MSDERHYEYISWHRFYGMCARLHERIVASGYQPQSIVGITRGGYMPARILADFFGLMALTTIKIEHYHGLQKAPAAVVREPLAADIAGQRVLLVDDVSDSGDSFDVALAHLRERGHPSELRTAVLHHKTSSTYQPDYFARRVVKWRWIIYPWAVVEDLKVLLDGLSPRPQTLTEAERRLRSQHGLRIPRRVLRQVADPLRLAAR